MTNPPTYIFPKAIARKMARISPKAQYEAQMMGLAWMMVGLLLSGIYFLIYFEFALWYKFVLSINVIAGLFVMSASIITTYQQYLAYNQAMDFQKELISSYPGKRITDNPLDINTMKAQIKNTRYTFGGITGIIGVILIVVSLYWIKNDLWKYILSVIGIVLILYATYIITFTNDFIKNKKFEEEY